MMIKILVMLILGVSAVLAEQVPVEVQQVINDIMSGKGNYFTPPNYIKLSAITAGEPIHCSWFVGDSLIKLGEGAPVSSVIKPLDLWAVPLLNKDVTKVLMIIAKPPRDPKWQVLGYGHGSVGRSWEKIRQIWPESAGYHPVLIFAPSDPRGFFYIPEKGDKNLTPLTFPHRQTNNLDSLYGILDSSRVVLKEIRDGLLANLKKGKQK
jgi:hypothetical protein